MNTSALPLIAAALLLVQACSTKSAAPTTDQTTLSALRASQEEPYGVPDMGVDLNVRASLAAVKWSQLSDDQLLSWARIWSEVRSDEDRSLGGGDLEDADGSSLYRTLFDRGPKDGFCIAMALDQTDREVPARIRDFLESIAKV